MPDPTAQPDGFGSDTEVLFRFNDLRFDGLNTTIDIRHRPAFDLSWGRVDCLLIPYRVDRRQILFIKSSSHTAPHLFAGYVHHARVFVRLVAPGAGACELVSEPVLQRGGHYSLRVAFGKDGLRLRIDGRLHAFSSFRGDLLGNDGSFILGAGVLNHTSPYAPLGDFFNGRMTTISLHALKLCDTGA